MPNQSGKIILVLILLLLSIGAVVYFFLPVFKKQDFTEQIPIYSPKPSASYKEASSIPMETKDYYSKSLKIGFQISENALVSEKFTDILITLSDGTVKIRRIGTNFSNINEYLNNLKEVNELKFLTETAKKVSKYDAIIITMQDPNSKLKTLKEYLLYSNNWVFKFSTSDEALYPVLDQIVQSFEYRP